jgi:hypothetical protein
MANRKQDEHLPHVLSGAVMTQVAILRFLVEEGVIDRGRLVAFLEKRGTMWGKTASDAALIPLLAIVTAIASAAEPEFPETFH